MSKKKVLSQIVKENDIHNIAPADYRQLAIIVEFCHEVTSAPVQQCRKDDRHCKKHKL